MTDRNWMDVSELGPEDVQKVLPHRYPFLMIDKVLEIKTSKPLSSAMSEKELNEARKGSFAKTIKNVTQSEPQFQGHFPGRPIFPGVLTLETMAQSGAFVALPFLSALKDGALPKLEVALVSFDKVRFRTPVLPGDQLETTVTATSVKGKIWNFTGEALVRGKKVAEGQFMAFVSI